MYLIYCLHDCQGVVEQMVHGVEVLTMEDLGEGCELRSQTMTDERQRYLFGLLTTKAECNG